MTQPHLHACRLDGNGGSEDINPDTLAEQGTDTQSVWVHLDGSQKSTRKWLHAHFGPENRLLVDALMDLETRPRMVRMGEGVLLILRGANLNDNAHPEDMVSIRIYADAKRVISVQRRGLKAVLDVRDALARGKGPIRDAQILTMLIDRLAERMEPVLAALDDLTDHLEEKVLVTGSDKLRQNIIDARRQAIMFRRYVAPQREAIAGLRQADLDWITEVDQRALHESQDQLSRFVEDLDAIRERAQIVKDELASMMADRLNKNMYVLSLIAAIFLPLGFLTGLFGINIGGMPGVDNHHAFWIFAGALVVIVALQIWIFRKMKWF